MSGDDDLDPAFAHFDECSTHLNPSLDEHVLDLVGYDDCDGNAVHRLTLEDELEFEQRHDDFDEVNLLGDGFGKIIGDDDDVDGSDQGAQAEQIEDTTLGSRDAERLGQYNESDSGYGHGPNLSFDSDGGRAGLTEAGDAVLDVEEDHSGMEYSTDTLHAGTRRRSSVHVQQMWTLSSASSSTTRRPHSFVQDTSTATSVSGFGSDDLNGALDDPIEATDIIPVALLDETWHANRRFSEILAIHTSREAEPSRTPSIAPVLGDRPDDDSMLNFVDRQPLLEKLASDLVRAMHDESHRREAQLKELVEFERVINRCDAAWIQAMASVEPLPDWCLDVSPLASTEGVRGAIVRSSTTSVLSSEISLPSQQGPPAISDEMVVLREATSSFIASLSSINEVTQVNSVAAADVGRKMRAFRNQVAGVADEMASLKKSLAFVERDFAALQQQNGKARQSKADAARNLVADVQRTLDESWSRAVKMLAVES
ncbi:hypothetical protein OIV83_005823 [Microbotryomycetes sp. JL201]|nr:hypothetical protein OIV83_005823 [Microbotryomycetes sp. JL201]